jgi:hypothetical protein
MRQKKISVPIPLNRWFNDVKAVQELRDLLESEAFQTAVAILKDAAAPSYATLADGETNNLRLSWYAGYGDFVKDLQKLTKLPATQQQSIEEWTHIQNP